VTPTGQGLDEALHRQASACKTLGSLQYAHLLEAMRSDLQRGGLVHELLADRPEDPLRDALVLRLLGTVHLLVLRGQAPPLAARYPSAGGDGEPIPLEDFLSVVAEHRGEIVDGLGRTVQTNEVGRCAALLPAFAEVARATSLPLNMLEVGASAGLLSNWDRYRYECFDTTFGDATSPVRLSDRWSEPFDLSGVTDVVSREACDIAPLDIGNPDNRLRLLSFVWPDQHPRFELLARALDVAASHPPAVDQADAAEWLAERLPQRSAGTAAVVFHSIVWQYLPRTTKDRMRELLAAEGAAATAKRPVAWVRMEPAGTQADVRVTMWPGGTERRIALTGYHGLDVRRADPET
jgi:hypothetical protein